jgi:hypothetical protein
MAAPMPDPPPVTSTLRSLNSGKDALKFVTVFLPAASIPLFGTQFDNVELSDYAAAPVKAPGHV